MLKLSSWKICVTKWTVRKCIHRCLKVTVHFCFLLKCIEYICHSAVNAFSSRNWIYFCKLLIFGAFFLLEMFVLPKRWKTVHENIPRHEHQNQDDDVVKLLFLFLCHYIISDILRWFMHSMTSQKVSCVVIYTFVLQKTLNTHEFLNVNFHDLWNNAILCHMMFPSQDKGKSMVLAGVVRSVWPL